MDASLRWHDSQRRMSSSRVVHQAPHPPHAVAQPGEDRLANEKVADVEFGQLRDPCNGCDIVEGEPMPRMRLDPVLGRQSRGIGNAAQLLGALLSLHMCIAAGVK